MTGSSSTSVTSASTTTMTSLVAPQQPNVNISAAANAHLQQFLSKAQVRLSCINSCLFTASDVRKCQMLMLFIVAISTSGETQRCLSIVHRHHYRQQSQHHLTVL